MAETLQMMSHRRKQHHSNIEQKKRKLPNRTNNTHIAEHEKAHNAQLVY